MSKKFNRTAKKTGSDRPEPKNYTQILIVSEDTKSSVSYLNALWRELSQSKGNVLQKSVQIISSHKGSSPDQVLASAEEKNDEMDGFDEVFCVMDVDSHKTLNNTLQRIRGDGFRNKGYHAIVSNPCFEYWVYLHLCESDAPDPC